MSKYAKFIVTDLKNVHHIPQYLYSYDAALDFYNSMPHDDVLADWVIIARPESNSISDFDKLSIFSAELISYIDDEKSAYEAWGNDEEVEVLEKLKIFIDSKLKDEPAYSVSQAIHNMYTEVIELRGKS